jgi:hypothetical protein
MKILAMAASILVFSWSHAYHPEQKVIGGATFTGVYLWGWENDMTAAIMSHAGASAAILLLGYSSLGAIAAMRTLAIIVAAVSLLVLVLRMVYPLTSVLVKAYVRFLQKIPRLRRNRDR